MAIAAPLLNVLQGLAAGGAAAALMNFVQNSWSDLSTGVQQWLSTFQSFSDLGNAAQAAGLYTRVGEAITTDLVSSAGMTQNIELSHDLQAKAVEAQNLFSDAQATAEQHAQVAQISNFLAGAADIAQNALAATGNRTDAINTAGSVVYAQTLAITANPAKAEQARQAAMASAASAIPIPGVKPGEVALPAAAAGAGAVALPVEVALPGEGGTLYTLPVPGVGVDASSIAAGLATLPVAMATALASTAATSAHNGQIAQSLCGASTGMNMLGKLAEAAMPLITTVAMEKFGPLRALWDQLFGRIWSEIVDTPQLQKPVRPGDTPALSRHLFFKAAELGQSAHFISVLGETFTPLKTLGLGQLSAFLVDMAGFAKIGGAMMGALESQALVLPFRYYINERVRSVLPDIRTAMNLLSQRQITVKQFDQLLAYNGIAPDYSKGYRDLAYRPATGRMLGQVADMGIYDKDYFQKELENGQYRDETVDVMMKMLYARAHGELKTLFTSSAMKRYKAGMDNQGQLENNLRMLGVPEQILPKYFYAANLDVELDKYLDDQASLNEGQKELSPVMTSVALKRRYEGMDTEQQLFENLVALGQKKEVIPRYLLGARLQVELNEFLDSRKRVETTQSELKPMFTSSALSRYKNGLDSEWQLQDNLMMLGVSPTALPQYLYAADLDADLDEYTDYLASLKLAVQKGAIEPPDMTELLVRRGVRRERAELLSSTEALKLLKAKTKS